jgi:hypothetical protein
MAETASAGAACCLVPSVQQGLTFQIALKGHSSQQSAWPCRMSTGTDDAALWMRRMQYVVGQLAQQLQ